ncbi:conserved hypothetical protein [Vibrio chagasii]|nr:conserved hypothetical protein [Vibrio chagasii]
MAVYSVTYDLNAPRQDYDAVEKALSKYRHIKVMRTYWLIDTGDTVSNVRDSIGRVMSRNDELLVARLEGSWATKGVSDNVVKWLKGRTF